MKQQAEILKEAFSYQNQLTAYAYVVLQDWSLAEDVVQDLFVTVSIKWQSYDSKQALYPWLKRIVRNRAVDIIRARSKEFYCQDDALLNLVDKAFDENEQTLEQERRRIMGRALRNCIDSLSVSARSLLRDFYTEGKTCISIAETMKRSENSVYISLTRIRKKLRKCAEQKLSAGDF